LETQLITHPILVLSPNHIVRKGIFGGITPTYFLSRIT
jgi:hypothetical protein